jgi:hypothetical protein
MKPDVEQLGEEDGEPDGFPPRLPPELPHPLTHTTSPAAPMKIIFPLARHRIAGFPPPGPRSTIMFPLSVSVETVQFARQAGQCITRMLAGRHPETGIRCLTSGNVKIR